VVHVDFDAGISTQMQDIIALLEDHDLDQAETAVRSLLEKAEITSRDLARERKLIGLRNRLRGGLYEVQRGAPFTAAIMLRKALAVWQV
jgi:hypothetical protein